MSELRECLTGDEKDLVVKAIQKYPIGCGENSWFQRSGLSPYGAIKDDTKGLEWVTEYG
mgnify:FL=1|tara:strand:+ start:1324 stop:1500 length:177 start_codon:yes stop_codon:yes gene_type:complete